MIHIANLGQLLYRFLSFFELLYDLKTEGFYSLYDSL